MSDCFLIAKELFSSGQWHEYNDFFNKNIKNNLEFQQEKEWETIELYFWQGVAFLKQNLFEQAKESFDYLAKKYPYTHLSYEGNISVLLSQNQNERALELALLFQERFPNFWQSYHCCGMALMGVHEYDKAKIKFQKIKELFPNVLQGYEGCVLATKKMSVQKGATCGQDYLNTLKQLAYHKDATLHHKFDYIEHLIYFYLLNEAKAEVEILSEHQVRYYWVKGLIEQKALNYQQAYECFMTAYRTENINHWERFKVLSSARLTFLRLKKFDEYRDLVEQLKLVYDDEFFLLFWADLYSMQNSWRPGWKKAVERLESLIYQYGTGKYHLVVAYISYLLKLNRLSQAKSILAFALDKYPDKYELQKFDCILAHHQQDWQLAKQKFDDFYQKYPNDKTLFYYYTHILYCLGLFDEFKNTYQKYYQSEMGYLPKIDELAELRADLILKKYDKIKPISSENINTEMTKVQQIPFVIKPVIHNKENQVLIICIDGLIRGCQNQDWLNGLKDTNMLKELFEIQKTHHDFNGFAEYTKQFNFLLCRDFSDSFGLLNIKNNLQKIKAYIDKLNPKYVVIVGTSAGGFMASLYGQYLKANLIFAMMPRLQGFIDYYSDEKTKNSSHFFEKLQLHFGMTNPNVIDIGYLQNKYKGFISKTYMALCENEPLDALYVAGLDHNDKNLHISYFYGDEHGLLEYMGARQAYTEFTRIIEKELANNFELPMQRDIFSTIDGYKDSSFDRLQQ